jgi:thioredoxin-like negative regulator of GroEL
MKPDWDSLASEYEGSNKVVIADVDCTAGGKPLCEKFGVKGYPTIKYFNPPDEEGEDYKGARSLADLKKFAAAELGPGCSVDTLENCSDDQKAQLDEYIKMPAEERDAKLADLKKKMGDAEKAHEDLLKTLQSTYKESMDSLEKLKETSAPAIKLLKAATPSGAKPKAKDEV